MLYHSKWIVLALVKIFPSGMKKWITVHLSMWQHVNTNTILNQVKSLCGEFIYLNAVIFHQNLFLFFNICFSPFFSSVIDKNIKLHKIRYKTNSDTHWTVEKPYPTISCKELIPDKSFKKLIWKKILIYFLRKVNKYLNSSLIQNDLMIIPVILQ